MNNHEIIKSLIYPLYDICGDSCDSQKPVQLRNALYNSIITVVLLAVVCQSSFASMHVIKVINVIKSILKITNKLQICMENTNK